MGGGSGDPRAGAKRFPPRRLHKQYSTGFQGRFWEFLVPDGLFKKKKKSQIYPTSHLTDRETDGQGESSTTRRHNQETADGAVKLGWTEGRYNSTVG